MKKYLKITILVIMVMLISFANVYAADYADTPTTEKANVILNPSKSSVKIGETFTVSMLVKCETGVCDFDGVLKYDKTQIELVGTTANKNFSDISEENAQKDYQLSFLQKAGEAPKEATLVTLEFKVLDNVKVDDKINISVQEIELNDSNDNWIDIANSQTTVTVAKDQETPKPDDGNTVKPGNTNDENTIKPGTNNKDNTQANKVINYAGLGNYVFAIIAAVILIASISYIKYKQYKNI